MSCYDQLCLFHYLLHIMTTQHATAVVAHHSVIIISVVFKHLFNKLLFNLRLIFFQKFWQLAKQIREFISWKQLEVSYVVDM